jgi:hydrogenase maturation protein HypF
MERRRIVINGLVQGVGFRPFLYHRARQFQLTGWVRNNFAGVEIEVQGEVLALDSFVSAITREHPVTASIEELVSEARTLLAGETKFIIQASNNEAVWGAPLPDQGLCPDCRREFHDATDRRYQYAFNACAVCGPRFTIIRELPFDRERTAMDDFPLCPDCRREYDDPADRRFHAQTITCPACGPQLRFTGPAGEPFPNIDPAAEARRVLKGGGIIAVKGIGGYHLACDARNETAIAELRRRKGRDSRPFAVLFGDLAAVQAECEIDFSEAETLESPARPILLLRQKPTGTLARAVNPNLTEIGAFLPYTGIQILLFDASLDALVMTSGNRSGEPLTIDDSAAIRDLGPLVDGFLLHNREILWRCDDSVLRRQRGSLIGIRRSRGFAPAPYSMKHSLIPLLACGPQQKSIFALTKGDRIYLSQHQGDLDEKSAFLAYRETIDRWQSLLQLKPEWVVHDLHPEYNSTRYAQGLDLPKLPLQHHLAHLAGVVALQKIAGPVIGVVWDGSGYGTDGRIWGGEFFTGCETSWRRRAYFKYTPLPGGEVAILEPWRMAAAYLYQAHPEALAEWLAAHGLEHKWETLRAAMKLGINAPETSSAGRLFDGVAALTAGFHSANYEGEAAIRLEHLADHAVAGSYDFQINPKNDSLIIDPAVTVAAVFEDQKFASPGSVSMKFHRTMAETINEICARIRIDTGIKQVILCGGVFQNRLLLDLSWERLERNGFTIIVPEVLPINDGGIALGQAWLGSLMIERGIRDVLGDTG